MQSRKGVGQGDGDRESPPALVGIRELLREQNGYLKRISQMGVWELVRMRMILL